LVDAYVESGDARVELLLALARKDADVVGEEVRLSRLQVFFDTLQRQILDRLEALDHLAGDLIQRDVRGYLTHPRSTIHFLRSIAPKVRHGGRRLFVWLFDGMRYDTWTEVVRPLLAQTFAVERGLQGISALRHRVSVCALRGREGSAARSAKDRPHPRRTLCRKRQEGAD
jgi:hypothetical protein